VNRPIATAAAFACELVIFAVALFLAVTAEAWVPTIGLSRGVVPVYIALLLSFFVAGFVRFPWRRRAWEVGVAAVIIAWVVLGILVWNYQAGIMRFNPGAWLFRLEYLVSTENLARATVGCLGALGGFLSADRLTRGRPAGNATTVA
jgi:hypothetical protein